MLIQQFLNFKLPSTLKLIWITMSQNLICIYNCSVYVLLYRDQN